MGRIRRVFLRAGKSEKIRQQRHPWLFSGAFTPESIAEAGETVCVCDEHGNPVGYGHWDPNHPIRCRIFSWNSEKITPNERFWRQKIAEAITLRNQLGITSDTNAYRLINSEGDHLPGIVIDIYRDIAVIQLRTPGAMRLKPTLVRSLTEHFPELKGIYLRRESLSESEWIWGEAFPEVIIQENGLSFWVSIQKGQKTGFFLDQRDNRQLLRKYAKGKKVANFFAYTGGFTVYAGAAGASALLSVEIMEEPAGVIERNLALNGLSSSHHTLWVMDAFEALQKLPPNEWDIIILDPPAFTHHQDKLPQAVRAYREINRRALQLLPFGGLLFTFSCSAHVTPSLFRDILYQSAMEASRDIQLLHILHAPPDHPINIYHPQGEYLKGFVVRVL
ncbi:MAG: class I SAM-dependent rRNA methyltransferase [Bacteroidia bacterium]|nr:class I SAM-dependent rRNA methyltransferase [Bacteroidia bacterium]MDW8134199.1 class I SAM-dependent rRNA methyltransferase [Bacteroidia bacterium]